MLLHFTLVGHFPAQFKSRLTHFSSSCSAWIENASIKPYREFKEQFTKSAKSALKDAIEQIEGYIKEPEKYERLFESKEVGPDPNEEFDKLRSNESAVSENDVSTASITSSSFATPVKKATPGRKQKLEPKTNSSASSATSSATKVVIPRANQSAVKRSAAAAAAAATAATTLDTSLDNSSSSIAPTSATKPKRPRMSSTPRTNHLNNSKSGGGGDSDSGILVSLADSNSTANSSYAALAAVPRRSGVQNALLNRPSPLPLPDQPEIDMSQISETLQSKNIKPSPLRFGFLGLGLMGSGIVKNLINSGHKVVVWNRTETKCRAFREAGAQVGDTPSDVVDMTDIIFSCVADPQAAKDVSRIVI